MTDHPEALTRRRSLARAGGVLAAALGGSRLLEAEAEAGRSAEAAPAAVKAGLVRCVLTPETTEGPYYLDMEKLRRDIRENRRGVLLDLRTTVLDVATCKPIRGAAVDIWHCDAAGAYSGFARENTAGKTFLRGIQKTNAKGLARFLTVYPGWYPGRAVHIHVSVHVEGETIHTGQLFFPERVTDAVYKRSPYNRRPNRDMRNADDWIFQGARPSSVLKLARKGSGYIGTIRMGVRHS